jgi:CubicO group peptidase (beta-lactamase class C family)
MSNRWLAAPITRLAPLLLAGALLAACSTSDTLEGRSAETATTTTTTTVGWAYPDDDWRRAAPADAGLDATALEQLAAEAQAAGSECLVVTRDGVVVDERYWGPGGPAAPREVYSVSKSVTSTLVGIAQDGGLLDVDEPASTYIPAWAGTASAGVTIADLLSNDSGRHWDLSTDYAEMAVKARDKTAFAVALGQDAEPGTVWAYNNAAIQTLDAVLQVATGTAPADFAERELFDPIGMDSSRMTSDRAGNTLMFMGVESTCLDLARYGYLMLRGGQWEGEQIVSSAFVAAATGRSSTDLNAAYGYLWWLNQPGHIASPALATTGVGDQSTAEGQLAPGAPADVFWALGLNSQVVAVIPSEGIVAVRLGARPPADAPFGPREITDGLLTAVVNSR